MIHIVTEHFHGCLCCRIGIGPVLKLAFQSFKKCSVCDNRCRLPCSVRMRMKRAVPKDGSYLKEGSALPRYSSELALSPALELADDEEDALLDELGSGSGSGSGFGSGPRDTTMVTVVPSCT